MSEKRTKQYENPSHLEIVRSRKSKSMDLGKLCAHTQLTPHTDLQLFIDLSLVHLIQLGFSALQLIMEALALLFNPFEHLM